MNQLSKRGVGFVAFVIFTFAVTGAEPQWIVHEWGTFTSLQNESGETIGGINTDDEPVPQFVHRLADLLLIRPNEFPFFQGVPHCHPDVTMRLETPVLYFYPPKSGPKIQTASVKVRFRGGWLSEFYPAAIADAPGLKAEQFNFGPLRPGTISTLEWNDLRIGGAWPLRNTKEHVWTSPRAVNAASVQTTNGESEKFLFYRGVANLKAPLKISRDPNIDQLIFRGQLEMPAAKPVFIPKLWLVDIQPGGTIAFRELPPQTLMAGSTKFLMRTPAYFEPKEFAAANLGKLRTALQESLVAEGLFTDEAQALLNTWELSYFKSAGLRVFFIVPNEWTDFYLPLEISVPAKINRVMIGRIELVTPEQRRRLAEMGTFTKAQIVEEAGLLYKNCYAPELLRDQNAWTNMIAGTKPLAHYISVPKTFQSYLDLGRFRNALILDEAKRHATPGVTNFIYSHNLQAYQPVEQAPGIK